MSKVGAGRRITRSLLAAALIGAAFVLVSPRAEAVGTPTVDIAQITAPSQPSGTPFQYEIAYSCSVIAGTVCATDAVITVPLGAAAAWPVVLAPDVTHVDSYQVLGGDLVITLGDLAPGEAATLALTISPPNHTTPDGTTWALTPTLSTTDSGSVTSPQTVSSTATAAVTMTLLKNSDSVPYLIGSNATFTITPQCSEASTGDLDVTSAVLVDTLPVGLHYVSSTPPGTFDAGANTVTWTVPQLGLLCNSTQTGGPAFFTFIAAVGGQAGDGVIDGTQLTNHAEITGATVGGGTTTASADRQVTAVAGTITPGTASKSGLGPYTLNVGDPSTQSVNGTYLSGVLPGAPSTAFTVPAAANIASLTSATLTLQGVNATYRIDIGGGTGQSTFALTDPMPCATNNPSSALFQSNPAAGPLCQDPAFNPQYVNVSSSDANRTGAGNGVPAALIPQAVLLDGTTVPLVQVATSPQVVGPNGPGSRLFQIPAQFVGQVAALTFPAVTGMNSPVTFIEIGGYVPSGFQSGDTIRNIAHLDYFANAAPGGPSIDGGNVVGNIYIVDQAQLGIQKFGAAVGDSLNWSIATYLVSPGPAVAPLIVTDLLPAGVHISGLLVGPNVNLFLAGGNTAENVSLEIAPEVIDNFNATGRTLLRWTITAAQLNQRMPATGGNLNANVALPPIDADLPGTFLNDASVFYADAATRQDACNQFGTPEVVDPLDLDGTPNTFHCQDVDARTVAPLPGSAAQAVTKQVSTSANPTFVGYPGIGVIPPSGGTATYRLTWTNKGAVPLNAVTLYDLLPRPGDTGTLSTTQNQPRSSTFQPVLTGIAALPPGFIAAYSSSINPCRPEVLANADNPGCVDDWSTTAPVDLSTVLALRFVSNLTYQYNDTVVIDIAMSTPPVGAGDVAWNTFAANSVRVTNGIALPPVESTKVGIARPGFAHLGVTKVADTTEVSGGSQVSYAVTVINDGQVDLIDVLAHDTLPAGVTFVSATGGGSESGGVVSWTVGNLAIGGSQTFMVVVTMPFPATPSTFTNAFSATAVNPQTGNPVAVTPEHPCSASPSEVNSCATVLVTPTPHLVIAKSVDKSTALAGDTLIYTIDVRNTGSVDVVQALIYDGLPAGVTFVSSIPPAMPVELLPGVVLVPFAVDVAAGSTQTLTITVTVNGGTEGQTLQNVALGEETSGIPTTYENQCLWSALGAGFPASCVETASEAPQPAIAIAKSADRERVEAVGEVITYLFAVTNIGNLPLTDVSISDVQAAPAGGLDTGPTCPVTTLPAGASMTCTATYVVTQADLDNGSIDNSAVAHGISVATPAAPTPLPVDSGVSQTVVIAMAPTPTPSSTQSPTPSLTPTPSGTPSPSGTPTPSSAPSASPVPSVSPSGAPPVPSADVNSDPELANPAHPIDAPTHSSPYTGAQIVQMLWWGLMMLVAGIALLRASPARSIPSRRRPW